MKFTVSAEVLRPLVEAAAELAPGSGKIPQLEACRLDVGDPDHLVVSASNMVESIRLNHEPVRSPTPGSTFVPSVNLLRAIKAAKKEDVTISWDGKALHAVVQWGKTKVKLPTEPPANQRAFKRFDPKVKATTVPGAALAALIKRTAFAVQTDFASRTLGGVSIKVRTDKLELAATDGRRVAVARMPITGSNDADIVVTPTSSKSIIRLVEDEDGTVDLQTTGNVLILRGARGEASRRLLSGKFPDYEQHIPWTASKETKIDRKALIELIRNANLLKVTGGIETYFTFADNELKILAQASIEGTTAASMPIDWPWPEIKVNLDHTFVDQALKAMESEHVIVGLESAEAPVFVREISDAHEAINVIMPKVGNA